ncbi:MAG: tetratricopeptide repeat protein [Candidatus Hodarchaeota archaeon]
MSFSKQFEKGIALIKQGKYLEAHALLAKLLASLEKDHRTEHIQCLNELSFCLQYLGKLEEAQSKSQEALKLAQQSPPDFQGQAYALLNLGFIQSHLRIADHGITYYKQSLNIWEQLDDKSKISRTLNALGSDYLLFGEIRLATEYFEQSLIICEQLDDPSLTILPLCNLGIIHWLRGELSKAEGYIQRGLALCKSANYQRGIAMGSVVLAAIHWYRGELDMAEEYGKQAIEVFEQMKTPIEVVQASWIYISILLEKNNLKAATHYIDKLEQLSQGEASTYIQPLYQLLTALLKLKQHELTSALDWAGQARKNANMAQMFPLLTQTIHIQVQALLQLYSLTRQKEYKSQAIQLLKEMKQISQQNRFYKVQVEILMIEGMLKQVESAFPEALDLLEQAHTLAKEYGFMDQIQKTQEMTAHLNRQLIIFHKLHELSPQAFEQAQLTDMMAYLEVARKRIQQEQLKSL